MSDVVRSAEKRSRYPRRGGLTRLRPTQIRVCDHKSCGTPATWIKEIQFGPMRGTDDATVNVCDEHKRIPGGDVQTWVKDFPQQAWKS
jgi:hypothetical protein